jgi:threonine/homoserine/homoserine lactone efflux protein
MELTLIGIGLGLAAGSSPGPLSALVVAVSMERGFTAGARAALAPLLTDAPIVVLSLVLLKDLPASFLGSLTLLGGLFVIYLGHQGIKGASRTTSIDRVEPQMARDLWQGAVVNFLNPHPWIFWMSVGAPTLVSGWRQSPLDAMGYLVGFYVCIVGSKVVLAWLAARGGQTLSGAWFTRVLKLTGLLLACLGVVFCYRGAVQLWTAVHSGSTLSYLK